MPQLFTEDAEGRIQVAGFFLDGEPISLMLSHGVLSDQGRTYEAVCAQTAHCIFPPHWVTQQAAEISEAMGVQYHHGTFSKTHVEEATLEHAVFQLAGAMLLFYGMVIGACRVKEISTI